MLVSSRSPTNLLVAGENNLRVHSWSRQSFGSIWYKRDVCVLMCVQSKPQVLKTSVGRVCKHTNKFGCRRHGPGSGQHTCSIWMNICLPLSLSKYWWMKVRFAFTATCNSLGPHFLSQITLIPPAYIPGSPFFIYVHLILRFWATSFFRDTHDLTFVRWDQSKNIISDCWMGRRGMETLKSPPWSGPPLK